MLTRRQVLHRGVGAAAALTAAPLLAACGPASAPAPTATLAATVAATATPLPPPETTTIRLLLAACDLPIMAAASNLRDEGFTDVQFIDGAPLPALVGGKVDLAGSMFTYAPAVAVEAGQPVVALGGLHTGCVQIWAPQDVATLKDLRGRTVVVRSKAPDDTTYSFLAIAIKNAGLDPGSVNFVVQPDADLTKLFLDGKSDALFLAVQGAFAFQTNPANKGHLVLDQAMEAPWTQQVCCVLSTTTNWVKANPVAAKRALRAIYRAADNIPKDRADMAKVATDKGLFGGAPNVAVVRGAANMVSFDWRKYDTAESMRFHANLMNGVGLLKMTPDDAVTKATDLRFTRQLQTEITR